MYNEYFERRFRLNEAKQIISVCAAMVNRIFDTFLQESISVLGRMYKCRKHRNTLFFPKAFMCLSLLFVNSSIRYYSMRLVSSGREDFARPTWYKNIPPMEPNNCMTRNIRHRRQDVDAENN